MLPPNSTKEEEEKIEKTDKFIQENDDDIWTLRKITSQSFKRIFRPIETGSAEHMGVISGLGRTPRIVVDREVLGRIEADAVDNRPVIVMGVVNSFNTITKTGSVYSRDYAESIRVEYGIEGKLPRGDDFSWSQLNGRPIRMSGNFVRYMDGEVKKLLVHHVERVTDQDEIHDYFHHDRSPLPLK